MTPILQAKNLWKEYGDVCVLERINVSIAAGEFITVVGTSGCGKSTFLKLVLGTEAPSRGELLLDGAPVPQEPDEHRGIVFQKYSVFPHLTALGNVLLAMP
jgi:NitT/TauT family transport system ATP-binding protein